ncbi:hypothetical protein ACSFC0_16150 [Serratia marcescens]|uniref:hypothetical protein n=1 Tax=Serratia marcescens TaxID=615 RepID=UPI003ED9E491
MAVILKVTIQQTETGVSTNICAEGPCTPGESEQAKFIYQTVVDALQKRPGYRNTGNDVCNVTNINKGNNNVH